MLLTEDEIRQAINQVKDTFPSFSEWDYNNEINDSYCGFSVWGQFTFVNNDSTRYFFITFDAYENKWQGHLSIGKPCYFWSSTQEGDAYLIDTQPCNTLEESLLALKVEIANLFNALLH